MSHHRGGWDRKLLGILDGHPAKPEPARAVYLSLHTGNPDDEPRRVTGRIDRRGLTLDPPMPLQVRSVALWTQPTGGRMLTTDEVRALLWPSRALPMPEVFLPLPRLRLYRGL